MILTEKNIYRSILERAKEIQELQEYLKNLYKAIGQATKEEQQQLDVEAYLAAHCDETDPADGVDPLYVVTRKQCLRVEKLRKERKEAIKLILEEERRVRIIKIMVQNKKKNSDDL